MASGEDSDNISATWVFTEGLNMNTLLYCEINIFCIAVLVVIAIKMHKVGD